MTSNEKPQEHESGKFYTIFVDDTEFRVEQDSMTGIAIMELAGIPSDAGLLLVHEDGTQERVDAGQTIELQPGRRFKKAPRFKRG